MNRIANLIIALVLAVLPMPATATAAAEKLVSVNSNPASAAGTWRGAIKIPGQELRVIVRLQDAAGSLSGTIDIPQQAASGLALDSVSLTGDRIRFQIAGVPGSPTFDGVLKADTIEGHFTQAGQRFPFELQREGSPGAAAAAASSARPQDPKPPFPYASEDVTFRNGPVTLAGTLTIPEGRGPFPAVILISGSGPQDRNCELFDHRPFLVLADHLSRAGIAVLRYDDRGVGQSTGDYQSAMLKDFAADAEAAVRFLKSRRDIRGIGLLGHSEGGEIAASVAARNRDVAFVVMIAGPGVPGRDLMVEQNRRIMLAGGAGAAQADLVAQRAAAVFDAALNNAPQSELLEKTRALAEAQSGMTLNDAASEAALRAEVEQLRSPRFLELLRHDPRTDLRRIRVPVLAINGDKDVQVCSKQNLPAIEEAVRAGGNAKVTARELRGLNHLLQPARTGNPDEYGMIAQTIDASALEAIGQWILDNAPAQRGR